MVLVLVLLPAVAVPLGGTPVDGQALTAGGLARSIALAIGNVIAFLLLMFVAGRRVVPWLLAHVARLGSRELFTLTVLAIALGVGTIASQLFGMSFALGAFVAGAVVSESELSHRAAADALPLQDAFAVLFFVSVGLLFDPHVLVDRTRSPEPQRTTVGWIASCVGGGTSHMGGAAYRFHPDDFRLQARFGAYESVADAAWEANQPSSSLAALMAPWLAVRNAVCNWAS